MTDERRRETKAVGHPEASKQERPRPGRDEHHRRDDDRPRDHDDGHDQNRARPEDREYEPREHERHELRRHRDDDNRRENASRHEDEDEPPLRKIVERVWYFGRDDDGRRRDDDDHDGHGGDGGGPGRPTRPQDPETGRLGTGGPLTGGDINNPLPPSVWVGPRVDMDLPLLMMRTNPADLGQRPVKNAPFWESPDIFLLAGVTPAMAPPIPAELGQIALSGQPNTIYAHVWNFGKASANEVLVEFYWCNPSLGIDAGSVQLIAQTTTSLGAKSSGKNHRLVKCPEAWTPAFVNGGHECLLVRVWDNPADLPGEPKFDASQNRHIAQRNIHVVDTGGGAGLHALRALVKPRGPALEQPVLIKVGALYGAPARVAVERVAPSTVPWLQLRTGTRGVFPNMAPPTGLPTLSPPTTSGGGFPVTGGAAQQHVVGDDQHVAFTTTDQAPAPGEAHVYRVSAHQNGAIFGGYTVVILG